MLVSTTAPLHSNIPCPAIGNLAASLRLGPDATPRKCKCFCNGSVYCDSAPAEVADCNHLRVVLVAVLPQAAEEVMALGLEFVVTVLFNAPYSHMAAELDQWGGFLLVRVNSSVYHPVMYHTAWQTHNAL